MDSLDEIKLYLREFAQKRQWEKFHSPKNLSMALSVECSELMEHFQWMTEEHSHNLSSEELAPIADEIADVQLYLIRIADQLGIDILSAVKNKTLKNEEKYPVDLVKGSSKKYTHYQAMLNDKKDNN